MNASHPSGPPPAARAHVFRVCDYDLAATLSSGQVFRWRSCRPCAVAPDRGHHPTLRPQDSAAHSAAQVAWSGVVGQHPVLFRQAPAGVEAQVAEPIHDWTWLGDYLQTSVKLDNILASFPADQPMLAAVQACRGLRLLRQDPWECLASFILSSTKRITQIEQIVAELCRRFGDPLIPLSPGESVFSFPPAERLARCSEAELRACKAGFRAPHLLTAARSVASGRCDLSRLGWLPLAEARDQLMVLPGVGPKIADCVLLFAFGFAEAFPLDVWVLRALGQLYFPGRRMTPQRLREFAATHFGAQAGYAQQYLFHYMRTHFAKNAQP